MIRNGCLKIFLLLLLTFSKAHAQDCWTVTHNSKNILITTTEDTVANRIILKHEDLKKCGSLRIHYTEIPERNDWRRTIIAYNESGNEILTIPGNKWKLRNHKAKKLFKTATSLSLYTSSVPADSAVAATVRVRRVHLCTLVLQD